MRHFKLYDCVHIEHIRTEQMFCQYLNGYWIFGLQYVVVLLQDLNIGGVQALNPPGDLIVALM